MPLNVGNAQLMTERERNIKYLLKKLMILKKRGNRQVNRCGKPKTKY